MKIEYQDRIDDYLFGRMSDEERRLFEADAAKDAELKEQLTFTENVRQSMRSRSEKLAAMKEWKEDYQWSDAPAANRSGAAVRVLYWVSGIAALFVVGFFLTRSFIVTDNGNGSEPSWENGDAIVRAGSDNSDIDSLLNQRKYEEALDLIASKEQTIENDLEETSQDSTLNERQKDYSLQLAKAKQDELKWLEVQARLGLGQEEIAIRLLDDLRKEAGDYQMKADSLYNLLNRQ